MFVTYSQVPVIGGNGAGTKGVPAGVPGSMQIGVGGLPPLMGVPGSTMGVGGVTTTGVLGGGDE